jgi:NADH-quinone oxidoreductase subunit C/D
MTHEPTSSTPNSSYIPDPRIPPDLRGTVHLTTMDKLLSGLYNWGRKRSCWPMLFGLACCGIEMICTWASRFDIERFGMMPRASPRQADLMFVAGTVTKKMAPQVVRLYNQMPEPKYVISMGACATSGGPFKEGYNVVSGIDKLMPVDVYIPGCPPTPQALLNGIIALHTKMDSQHISETPWYGKYELPEYPVPILGPDIVDLKRVDEIARAARGHSVGASVSPDEAAEQGLRSGTANPNLAVETPPTIPTTGATDVFFLQLDHAFPGAFTSPHLEGHEGYVVAADRLVDVARYMRDGMGYNYLSSVTAVDYARQGYFEVVYHVYSTERGGGPMMLKARADAADPALPSLVSIWPGAEFQEREAWDLMGIRFKDHPDLRRILLWDGFEGHPLRKDWQEPYYEADVKPFKSRWPEGRHAYAEERAPWGDNVRYPSNYVPDANATLSQEDQLLYTSLGQFSQDGRDLFSEPMIVNMGPHHPSTHGVFRMVVKLDGETVLDLKPVLGYLHRCHEKIGERNTWLGNMPFTDRLDYITSMTNNFGYAVAVEKLLKVEVPERAEYLRVIMAEFTRIINHLWLVGFLFNDLGAFFTPMLYAAEDRELILDLFEMASGSRMMCNYFRFGGVARDVPPQFLPQARALVEERLPRVIDELDAYLTENEIFRARAIGVGILPPERAIALSVTGPMLRASGVPYDVRRAEPYSIYDRFDFDVVTNDGCDVYARYLVRLEEMRQSLRILKQALDQIPEGPIQGGKTSHMLRVPAGDAYARIESPKGELGFYLVSDGTANPYRYHVRAPTFINLTCLAEMCRGMKIADTVVIFGSVDITLAEVDR